MFEAESSVAVVEVPDDVDGRDVEDDDGEVADDVPGVDVVWAIK